MSMRHSTRLPRALLRDVAHNPTPAAHGPKHQPTAHALPHHTTRTVLVTTTMLVSSARWVARLNLSCMNTAGGWRADGGAVGGAGAGMAAATGGASCRQHSAAHLVIISEALATAETKHCETHLHHPETASNPNSSTLL